MWNEKRVQGGDQCNFLFISVLICFFNAVVDKFIFIAGANATATLNCNEDDEQTI